MTNVERVDCTSLTIRVKLRAVECELQQQVDARSDSVAQWREAMEGQSVFVGGGVKTRDEARARLDISDGTTGQATDLSQDQQATIAGAGQNPSPAQPMEAAQYADWVRNFPEAPTPPLTSILLSPGDGQCSPNTFPAGVVELTMGVGRWMTPEEAAAAIGDSNPTITLNGEPVTIHDRTGPERHPGDDPAWGFSVRAYVLLEPGEYTITSPWHWDLVFNCVIEVTGP